MRHRFLGMVIMALASMPSAAQTPKPASTTVKAAAAAKPWTPPKTPWGDPDLQGTYTSDDYIGLGLQRNPQFGDRLYFTDQEMAQREAQIKNQATTDLQDTANPGGRIGTGPPSHWGERARRSPRQTSLIVDPPNGRLPEMTAEAQAIVVPIGANEADPKVESWEAFTHYIRCITRGIAGSMLPVPYGNGTQIVQSPGYVAIMNEMVHEARIIPLSKGPRASSNIRTYMGDSRGHWEGSTLVIETTNFLPRKTGLGGNGGGTPLSDAARLTERYTRVDADTINYELNVIDEKTYVTPIKIAFPIRQERGYELFEYACHEGNYGMHNQLSAARAVERAEEEAKQKK